MIDHGEGLLRRLRTIIHTGQQVRVHVGHEGS